MKNITVAVVAFFLMLPCAYADDNALHETPPLDFVKLYIEQLGDIEQVRENADKEFTKDDNANEKVADCVHAMTKFQLELSSQISAMQAVHLNKKLDFLPQGLADFYKQKRDLYKEYGDGCTAIMEGPKPNVDYGKVAASLPKINAQIEYVDKGIFKTAPAVFASLIMMKENSHGGADHLVITKAERDGLAKRIQQIFGDKLKQDNQNFIVSAASVLQFYLEKKGYRGSDEPWN